MNAIDTLTREKLNIQQWLDQCSPKEGSFHAQQMYEKKKRELANIERALETLEAEALKKTVIE